MQDVELKAPPTPAVDNSRVIMCAFTELVDIEKLWPHPRNPNNHPDEQIAAFSNILRFQGWRRPITVSRLSGFITKGHGALMTAKKLGLEQVPVDYQDYASEAQELADLVADNQLARMSHIDLGTIQQIHVDLKTVGVAGELMGFDGIQLKRLDTGLDPVSGKPREPGSGGGGGGGGSSKTGALAAKFGVPPFSVLDARRGYWKERKAAWQELGIRSEVGRKGNLLGMSNTILEPDPEKRAQMAPLAEYDGGNAFSGAGTSIFDPVLCELAYRWFSPEGGLVLDPFAGGSVRGVVASRLGRRYVGVELREEQVLANRDQGAALCEDPLPHWHCGDSADLGTLADGIEADLVFSCPPYADLEVYSDDPRDISNMPYERFREVYASIIRQAVEKLHPDRFAVWVIGEVRNKDRAGFYRGFVSDTIAAFEAAGASYYNEAILVTSVGTLPLRAGKVFSSARKLGKTHQNMLVFCKGDPFKAAAACGSPEFGDIELQGEGEPAAGGSEFGEEMP